MLLIATIVVCFSVKPKKSLVLKVSSRALFNRVLKMIQNSAFVLLYYTLRLVESKSSLHLLNQSDVLKTIGTWLPAFSFPALGASHGYFLCVLIGSLRVYYISYNWSLVCNTQWKSGADNNLISF